MNYLKSVQVVPYIPSSLNYLESRIASLKGKGITQKALLALEGVAFAFSLIGLPAALRAWSFACRLSSEQAFASFVKNKTPPLLSEQVLFKTGCRAFTHVHEYAVEDGVIWYRIIGKREWLPLYFDGFLKGERPCRIDADGANLMVLDQYNQVHYKKVIKEYFPAQIHALSNRHLDGAEVDQNTYLAVDKASQNNWKDRWFTLPYVNRLTQTVAPKRLTLSAFRSFAVSHRGRYNGYCEDAAGRPHLEIGGVTTLYVLSRDGSTIRLYDPWSPTWSQVSLHLPATPSTTFEALKISVSASTVMTIGYNFDHMTGIKTLKILTLLYDIDTSGGNPWLKYGFFSDKQEADVRVLNPVVDWLEHDMPKGYQLTDIITILQTGEGNDARELRVHVEGGYLAKKICEKNWSFIRGDLILEGAKFLPSRLFMTPPIERRAHNYQSLFYDAVLHQFGSNMTHSISLFFNGRRIKLVLCPLISFWNFIGFSGKRYEVVVPKEYHQDEQVLALVNHQRSFKVDLKLQGDDVLIYLPSQVLVFKRN